MTDAISAGTQTREQRRARIEQLFAEIAREESLEALEAAQVRLVVDGLRRSRE